jgi:hypothetical protein
MFSSIIVAPPGAGLLLWPAAAILEISAIYPSRGPLFSARSSLQYIVRNVKGNNLCVRFSFANYLVVHDMRLPLIAKVNLVVTPLPVDAAEAGEAI